MISTQIIADTGSIGALTADHFSGVFVNAQHGAIASVTAHTATAAAAWWYLFHAGTDIGPITAQNDKLGGVGLDFNLQSDRLWHDHRDRHRRSAAKGIVDSVFSTGGNFNGEIRATAASMVAPVPIVASAAALFRAGDRSWAGSPLRKAISTTNNG